MSTDPFQLRSGEFEGRLRNSSLPSGGTEAHLFVTRDAVIARLESGEELELPLRGMRLRRSDEGALIATSAGGKRSVSCGDPGFLRAIETAGGNDLNQEISRLTGERVGSGSKQLVGCLAAILFVGFLWWAVPKLFRKSLDAAVDALPTTLDEQLGEMAEGSMDPGGRVTEDEILTAAIKEMIRRLEPHALRTKDEGWTFRYRIVESDVVNAFALPGGYITVFTGLITESDSPEQVAGVLAHEMAHVTLRHGMRRMAHSLGMMAGVSLVLGDLGGLESIAVELFTLSQVNGYSQDQEAGADTEGVRMMIAAGLDPEALAGFFRLLERKYGDVPDELSWISTHPKHQERITAIRAQVAKAGTLPEWEPLDIDWEAVRAAASAD